MYISIHIPNPNLKCLLVQFKSTIPFDARSFLRQKRKHVSRSGAQTWDANDDKLRGRLFSSHFTVLFNYINKYLQ